ncbi:hypothetical protein WDL53_000287 [Salmonella enterica]|nr:hypothetical protein [Salmonella enterica]
MTTQLAFHDTKFNIISRNNQIWLSSKEIANALGYAKTNAITKIYNQNSDEFTVGMTEVIESTANENSVVPKSGISKNLKIRSRIFSLRGAHLIAMFARTPVAKEFRRWVLDILDREMKQQPSVRQMSPAVEMLNIDILLAIRDGEVAFINQYSAGSLMTVEEALSLLRKRGWLVMSREEVAERLATW